MNHLHAQQPSRAPKPPSGVVQATVRFANTAGVTEAARSEWFISGTQQATFAMDSGAGRAISTRARGQKDTKSTPGTARITAPTSGTIIALDPDIPPNRQRVLFEATGDKLVWQMDGKVFAKGPTAQWLPWPGRHVVRITNARGEML